VVKKAFPVLVEMEKRLASIQTRNRGSIGGNICHGDPAGDPAPVLLSLGATLKVAGVSGERTIDLDGFYADYFETTLGHNELLVEIEIPAAPARSGAVYYKFNIIESDLATVSVAVGLTLDKDDSCKDVKIALGSCAPTAFRAKKAEAVLKGNKITDKLLTEAGETASGETEPISDIYASAEYRRELVKVLVKRMGQEALNRAKKA
jgi:carbon-monoxide dehydrogenase medium subunit